MCDPVTIGITLATQAAKSYLENKAINKVNKARTAVTQKNIADQARYRQAAINAEQQAQTSAARPAMDAATQAAEADLASAYQAPPKLTEMLPGQGDTSQAVKESIVQALSSGVQNANDAAARKAALDAYSKAAFGRDIGVARSAGDVAQQADFSRGRASLLPLQYEAANRAGDGLSRMAGLVGALGTVGGAAYSAGAFNPMTSGSTMGQYGAGFGRYGNLGRVDWLPAAKPAGWVDWTGGKSTYYG